MEIPKWPCYDQRCAKKVKWDAFGKLWTRQHGDNPEHRRTFTLQELLASDVILVRRSCSCSMGEHEDEVYKVEYDWLKAIHEREGP